MDCNRNIVIRKWRGRFGNNVVQIINAINLGLRYGYNIVLAEHKYFKQNFITISGNINLSLNQINDKNEFLYYSNPLDLEKLNSKFSLQRNKLIRKIFNLQIPCEPLPLDTLVIHLRGGDNFNASIYQPTYIVPPLSYYDNIIANGNYKKVILISEDRNNPCVDKLIEKYDHVTYTQQSLESDLNIILSAQQLVISYGSFIPGLLLFSNNIRTLYIPSNMQFSLIFFCIENIRIFVTNLVEYTKIMYPWKNLPQQIETIINYELISKDMYELAIPAPQTQSHPQPPPS